MNAYKDYLADTTAPRDQLRILAAMRSVLRQMDEVLKRGAEAVRLRPWQATSSDWTTGC